MAVYFQFKSSIIKESIPIDCHYITVKDLKEKIIKFKNFRKRDSIVVTNSQTKEDYVDDEALIPKYTTVLIRRGAGIPINPIVVTPPPEPESGDVQVLNSSLVEVDSSTMKYPEDVEWDAFVNDLNANPESLSSQTSSLVTVDEDSKIKALVDKPALDWQGQSANGYGTGGGFGHGMRGRMTGLGELEGKLPPQGYICHRCNVPGHFIQHCPTNGDPNYDIKRVKPPTGISKSMLMATANGSYALSSGAAAVLKPSEAAFEKDIGGLSSSRSVGDLPPELNCPLCKKVMKDAVFASKCCFRSFCDKCIREHTIAKSMCACGATNLLADDLLPNKTLRDTINRILESNSNSSGENGGNASHIQDMESRNSLSRALSSAHSVISKEEQCPPPTREEKTLEVHEVVEELASKGSPPLANEEAQKKLVSGETTAKKEKKEPRLPLVGVADSEMQCRAGQDLSVDNYMMSMGPAAYNPYWTGMQPGMDAFMPPYAGVVPYRGFGCPLDLPFGGVLPQNPFGGHGFMLPFGPPQRDLSNFVTGFTAGPLSLSREEFEAGNLKRKREIQRRGESQELLKDHEYGEEVSSSCDVSLMKFKSKVVPPTSSSDHHHHGHSSCDPALRRPSSNHKSDYNNDHNRYRDHCNEYYLDTKHHHRDRQYERHNRDHSYQSSKSRSHHRSESTARPTISAVDKEKPSVFSHTNSPVEDQTVASKKRKLYSSSEAPASASEIHRDPSNRHYEHKVTSGDRRQRAVPATLDYELSDEERNFKRRTSLYEEVQEEHRHSKRSRERERDKEWGSHPCISNPCVGGMQMAVSDTAKGSSRLQTLLVTY